MFRADVENADDVRFSVKLFRTCLPEKREFCADIEPGNARAKECLRTTAAVLALDQGAGVRLPLLAVQITHTAHASVDARSCQVCKLQCAALVSCIPAFGSAQKLGCKPLSLVAYAVWLYCCQVLWTGAPRSSGL